MSLEPGPDSAPLSELESGQGRARGRSPIALRWAGPELDAGALGIASLEALFDATTSLAPRCKLLEDSGACARLRFPLPGTPDLRGNLTGKVGPLGTGWLWLSVERRSPWRELALARCTQPRSASLAEREWNLLCHLRRNGVGTPEPVLVGTRGAGPVARRSFLLVRAQEEGFPLLRYLRTDGTGAERERILRALGLVLANLARARVLLPHLAAEHLWVTPSGSGECETHEDGAGPSKNKLPGVAVTLVRGGRILARAPGPAQIARLLQDLAPSTTAEEREELAARATG